MLAPSGAIGLITGPLALLGRLGNILSYLRLAAVGLASAHLASVANELATIGPIWMGVVVAAFFHALNLALASFSPMIQALRLHYVEFFGTFLTGGGRAFAPFGRAGARDLIHDLKEQTWRLDLIAIGAALAVGLSAIATGFAQARIGAAAMGVIAEKPELAGRAILLVAIPETLVILGFAVAAMTIVLL